MQVKYTINYLSLIFCIVQFLIVEIFHFQSFVEFYSATVRLDSSAYSIISRDKHAVCFPGLGCVLESRKTWTMCIFVRREVFISLFITSWIIKYLSVGIMSRYRDDDSWFQGGGRNRQRRLSGEGREFKQDFRPGDWVCQASNCSAHNFAKRNTCFKCDASRDGSGRGGGRRGRSRSPYRKSRSPPRRRSPVYRDYREKRNFNQREGDWECYDCGFNNFSRRDRCFDCGRNRRGGGGGRGRGGPTERREGDWFCHSCDVNNFARRTECFKCGEPK